MDRKCLTLLLLFALLAAWPGGALAQRPQRRGRRPPPPPPASVPPLTREVLEKRGVERFNAEERGAGDVPPTRKRSAEFDPSEHERLNEQVVESPYARELWSALYLQDTYHQRESKAHFDNCDFEGGIAYINQLLAECDKFVNSSEAHKRAGRSRLADIQMRRAFFSLGQILHAVQDFYAHSNYVELMRDEGRAIDDVRPVPLWLPEGRDEVARLRSRGLVSGYVWWGRPKRCAGGVLGHAQLAKDSADSPAGRVVVARWENLTQHDAAYRLARAASSEFLDYAFGRWPALGEGSRVVAFKVFQDRRRM